MRGGEQRLGQQKLSCHDLPAQSFPNWGQMLGAQSYSSCTTAPGRGTSVWGNGNLSLLKQTYNIVKCKICQAVKNKMLGLPPPLWSPRKAEEYKALFCSQGGGQWVGGRGFQRSKGAHRVVSQAPALRHLASAVLMLPTWITIKSNEIWNLCTGLTFAQNLLLKYWGYFSDMPVLCGK